MKTEEMEKRIVEGVETVDAADARAAGYSMMAAPYRLPKERWMLDNVIADLRAVGARYLIVHDFGGVVEVWRRGLGPKQSRAFKRAKSRAMVKGRVEWAG